MYNEVEEYKYPYKRCTKCDQSLYPKFFEKESYKKKTITISEDPKKGGVGLFVKKCCFYSSMQIYGLQFVLKRYNIETSAFHKVGRNVFGQAIQKIINNLEKDLYGPQPLLVNYSTYEFLKKLEGDK